MPSAFVSYFIEPEQEVSFLGLSMFERNEAFLPQDGVGMDVHVHGNRTTGTDLYTPCKLAELINVDTVWQDRGHQESNLSERGRWDISKKVTLLRQPHQMRLPQHILPICAQPISMVEIAVSEQKTRLVGHAMGTPLPPVNLCQWKPFGEHSFAVRIPCNPREVVKVFVKVPQCAAV